MSYTQPLLALTLLLCCAVAFAEDWPRHVVDKKGRGADGVRMMDTNGDGLLDIACGWEEEGETRAYLHPGIENVRDPWLRVRVGKSGRAEDAVFCDVDGDGAYDVVSASEDKAIYVHWAPQQRKRYLDEKAWKTETLPCAKGVHNWMFTVPVQVDGKHGIDLIAAGKSDKLYWLEAPADARKLDEWKLHTISDKIGWTMGMQAVDMDGDGDRDVLVSIRDKHPGVKWFENPGLGGDVRKPWKSHEVGPQGMSMGFVDTGDIDGDGLLDVVSPMMDKQAVLLNRGLNRAGTQWQAIEIPTPHKRNKGIAISDMDGDGQSDLVITHEFWRAAWLAHDGNLNAEHWTYHPIGKGGKLDDATLYDVDGDGDLDVFTTDERGEQVIWFENVLSDRRRSKPEL